MNKTTLFFSFAVIMLTVACGNKVKPMGRPVYVDQPTVEQTVEDSAAAPIMEETKKSEDKSSEPARSSTPPYSQAKNKGHYYNMRGFDPASEDDMDDNGMSRYMENNDDEGWD